MAGINNKRNRRHNKNSLGTAGIYAVLTAWALTTIYPLFWILMNSFKDKKVIRSDSFSLPFGELFTLDNYRTAFDRVNILGAYRNSLVISLSVAAAVILLSGLASYALVRYDFKMKGLLNSMVVAGMMFPEKNGPEEDGTPGKESGMTWLCCAGNWWRSFSLIPTS